MIMMMMIMIMKIGISYSSTVKHALDYTTVSKSGREGALINRISGHISTYPN
jgi:hypothetical protein